jgi:hypothetical protein
MARYNSPHMLALAQSVAVKVLRDERKIRQSQTLPTLLIVDLSGGDLPDVRYLDTTYGPLWQPTDTYLALGAMHTLTTRRVPEIRFSVNPYADKAPSASPPSRCAALRPLPISRTGPTVGSADDGRAERQSARSSEVHGASRQVSLASRRLGHHGMWRPDRG